MKTITQKLMFLFLLLVVGVGYSQKVAVIGINHVSTAPATDGFTFVVTQDLAASEVIYFTENEYSDAANAFVDNAEATVVFTAGSALVKGTVVFVNESVTTADTFTVTCTGGGSCGTAVKLGTSGNFALATDGETFYAYSDSDSDPVNGVTTIHSVMFTGDTQPGIVNGGTIPANQNPSLDYPTAIVVDGFPAVQPNRVEFTPTTLARTDVSKVALENPSNYVHAQTNQALSTIFFTNLNLVALNPVVSVTASPLSVNENSGTGMVYTFLLSANATSNLTINFAVSGSATFSADYSQSGAASFNASTGTVTILNGTNSATVTLTPSGDGTLEANETVTLTLTSGSGYVAGSPGAATTTILNDDTLTINPIVAVTGVNHSTTADGISFVALQDIAAGTTIYFTENPFDSTTLTFTGAESVLSWTAPAGGLARGQVVVATEVALNTFTTTCSSGTCGNVVVVSGSFTLATTGEEMYAYLDSDSNPTNGVTSVQAVLYTGTSVTPGGNIPTNQDPGTMYPGAVVVDGFPAVNPLRTEYNPTLRGVTVDRANFQNPANWLHAQSNITLSTVPFANIIISTGVANPFASVTVAPSSVLENSGTPMVYTFSLTAPASGNITVNFGVSGSATFTTDYTASGASSFTASAGSVVIPNGSSSATVQITPVGDTGLEVQESVVLTITSGTGYDGGSPNVATGLINNDDTSNSDPIVAVTGISHATTDGFSFVAAQDIPANTVVYFTDNSFNNNTLLFGSGEAVIRWTSPGTVITKGNVVVVTETVTPDTFTVTCSNGTCGSIALLSGNFALATGGESLFAYEDNDTNPSNGVVDIYSVLFTGTPTVIGGTIPAIQDPSSIFLSALVVDGFPATAPARTEYDATKRGVLVTDVNFEDISNWVHAQSPPALSTVPFANLNILDSEAPNAICQNISVTPNVGSGSVTITAADINNGSTDNVGIVTYAIDIDTFTCANIGTPVTVTLTVTDAAGNSDTCTATVTVLPNATSTFTQVAPICAGDSFTLPTTSNNGFTGTWSPANDNTQTTTYTFTPDAGQCGSTATMTVTVNPVTVPTFTPVAPICAGGSLSALPTTSNNGITGTWSPGLNNTATTTYTFTPDSGTCIATATLTIAVNPLPTTPIVASNSPVCEGETVNLSVTNPVSYNMSPNSGVAFIDIDATGTSVGAISDDSEHNITLPSFNFNGAAYTTARVGNNGLVVFGSTTGEITFNNAALPTGAVGAGNTFLAPFWDDLDVTGPTSVKTQTVGNLFIIQYTLSSHFTGAGPTPGTITFQAQLDTATGAIHYVYQDVDFSDALFNNGVSATVGMQFSTSSAMQYSFNTASLVNGQSITFSPVSYAWTGPNSFSSTIQNPSIPNATLADAGTYNLVVTDVATNCSSAQGSATIVVNPIVTPAFTQEGPICTGDALSLPATSTNGVTGTWAPAIDNTATTTYTFTPDAGQCAVGATMTVVVNPLTSNTTTIAACDTYTWAVNGTTYTASGTYTSVNGCDTQTLNLTITPSTSNTTTISACDTYTWAVNGTTYTSSGTYNSVTGCDTQILNLTITPSTSNTTTITACDTYTWAVNGTTYTSSGTYTSVTGCDTQILNLTIDVLPTVDVQAAPALACENSTITLTANAFASQISGFNGDYGIANWTFSNANANGAVTTSGAPNSISLTSGNLGGGGSGNTNYTITVPVSGSISFNWSYSTGDGAQFDYPRVLINGSPTVFSGYSTSGSTSQSGTMTVNVAAGQTFAFNMFTTDNIFGAATVTISNFTANVLPALTWSASNGGTIVGATDQLSVNVTTSGTYTLTATNGSCTASDFVDVTFTPNVTPTFDAIAPVGPCAASPLPATSNNGITGTWSPAFNPLANATYTFTPNAGQCAVSTTLTVTIIAPPGDPSVFGNNVWNVYAWNAGGTEDTGSSWNTNYAGYYTIPSLSFDTQNQWCNTCSPSDAAGYQGCTVAVEDHSWSAKRRGFTPGVYSIDIPSHDDEAELWVNGVMVWEHVGCCDAHTAVWQGNLGAFDTVEYRATEGVGGSHGIITFNTLPFGPANLTATYCGATINNMAVTLVSNYVTNAQAYRFRVRNAVTGVIVGIVDRPVNSFALSNMAGITLATSYSIDVTIRVNNVWQPFYGAPCTVTTPTPLATIGAQCGTTLTSMGQWIYATYQPSVSAYRFRITNNSTSAVEIYNPVSGLNKFNFNQLPAAFRTFGTVYTVEVALRNTDGTYLPYGTPCNVTTPGVTKTNVAKLSEFVVITYPNPFAENFMFDVKTNSEAAFQIRVYDMLGKQVEYRNVETVDMASVQIGDVYPSGVYNVIVSQGESTQTLRVIKR